MAVTWSRGGIGEQQPVWARAKDVEVQEGWARVRVDISQMYEPRAYPQLASLLAKATTEAEVIRFLKNWGPLGFWRLIGEDERRIWPEKYRPGLLIECEPVEWVIAQAQTVGFALQLIEALNNLGKAGSEALEQVLLRRRLRVVQSELITSSGSGIPGRSYAAYYLARGAEYGGEGGKFADGREYGGGWFRSEIFPLYEGESATERHAQVIVAELVNANTEWLREQLRVDFHSGKFGLQLKARGLLEPIWLQVRNAALGGDVHRCVECDAPFIRTHKSQLFCPPDLPGSRSRCAARYHKRLERGK